MGLGAAIAAVGLGIVGTRAHADPTPPPAVPHDFYGEADNEVTAVAPAPLGMTCGSWSLTTQTTEPPEGFTGACLMDRAYASGLVPVSGVLPAVCFSPVGATSLADYSTPDGHPLGTGNTTGTPCSIPASQVAQPSWRIQVNPSSGQVVRQNQGSYRSMMTCVPHLAAATNCGGTFNSGCPCYTSPVSHSCCTPFATPMVSPDNGQTARANAMFW